MNSTFVAVENEDELAAASYDLNRRVVCGRDFGVASCLGTLPTAVVRRIRDERASMWGMVPLGCVVHLGSGECGMAVCSFDEAKPKANYG